MRDSLPALVALPTCAQDEVLTGVLSVRETIMYSALLRLPASMTHAEKASAGVQDVVLNQ